MTSCPIQVSKNMTNLAPVNWSLTQMLLPAPGLLGRAPGATQMAQAAARCNKGKIPNRLLKRKRHLFKNAFKLFTTVTQQKKHFISPHGKASQLPGREKKKRKQNKKNPTIAISSNTNDIPCIFHTYPFPIASPCFPFKRGAQEDNVQNCSWKMSLRQAKGQGSSGSVTRGWMNSGFPFPHPCPQHHFSAPSHHKCNIHLSFPDKWRNGSAAHQTQTQAHTHFKRDIFSKYLQGWRLPMWRSIFCF